MLLKLASVVISTAIVCTLGGTYAFAGNSANPAAKTDTANVPSEAPAKKEVKPIAKSQILTTKSNS